MAIHKAATWPWAGKHTFGTLKNKQIVSVTTGYTETQKAVAAGTTTAVLAATAGSTSATTTVTAGLTDPDVPRALVVTVGGTAADVQASSIVVNGTNVEGKSISESFKTTIGATSTINGTKAFRTVTSVVIPAQIGTGATFAVGTRNILGTNHRLFTNNTTVKVYSQTAPYGTLTLQSAPTVVADGDDIEKNLVTPAVAPDGTLMMTIWYLFDNWSDGTSISDEPEYSTTTSTSSTSSSTSVTTITTSTSSSISTSVSTSTSTSVSETTSTSSTSTSISTSVSTSISTSTSTTTVP